MQAQKDAANTSENKNSYLTANIFGIVDPIAPRFRFGYIQHIAPHWKVGLDIGVGAKEIAFASESSIGTNYFLWELRPELYFVFNPKARTIKYLSVELFYIEQKHVFVDDSFISEVRGDISYDQADFTRQKYGMHFKFGLFLNFGKHVGFDFYGGIGFRFIDNQYSNVINAQNSNAFWEWFTGPYDDEGRNFRPHPSLGVKFYYKL